MARETYILFEGELVLKSRDGEIGKDYLKVLEKQGRYQEKHCNLVSDTLGNSVNGIVNPVNGLLYDSKSQYNKAVRAAGCRVVGNDWNDKQFKRPDVRGDFNIRPQMREAVNRVLRGS